MEVNNKPILRTFTFRKASPISATNQNENRVVFPKKTLLKRSENEISSSSEVSENSQESLNRYDSIIENLIKQYKTYKSIPHSCISQFPIENIQVIIEKLLKEKTSLLEELSVDNSIDFNLEKQSEKAKSESNFSQNVPLKLHDFRALDNVSPIENDESDRMTNYKMISLALTPKEEIYPDMTLTKIHKINNYKKETVKLAKELKEILSYNSMLSLILSLNKECELTELNQLIKDKVKIYNFLTDHLANEVQVLKKSIEPSEGFMENLPFQRKNLKTLLKLVSDDTNFGLKPSEMEIIDKLLDLNQENSAKEFDKLVESLLASYDITEVAMMMIKYIRIIEEDGALELKASSLNCIIEEAKNESELEKIIHENAMLAKEELSLESEINKLSSKKSKNFIQDQLKIRTKTPGVNKEKWKLPSSLKELSGPELYSKTLAVLKKK